MNRTTNIDAIVNKAKKQRADYMGTKFQETVLPVALMAVLSLVLVQFAIGTPTQANQSPATQTTTTTQQG